MRQCDLVHAQNAFPLPAFAIGEFGSFWHRYAAAVREEFHGFREGNVLDLHDELEIVATHAAAKTLVDLSVRAQQPTDEYAQKEREKIVRALTECNGRVGGADGAAARMGINRTTLISRMKKLGIDPRQYAA